MRALEDTIAALGVPISCRTIGTSPAPLAAVARWRHGPVLFDVAPSNAIRLAVSLVDTQNAHTRDCRISADKKLGRSISVFAPMAGVSIEVRGEADIVQLLVDYDAAQAMLDQAFICPPVLDLRDDWTRATVMRLFVNAGRRGPDDELMEEESLLALIARLERHSNGWRRSRELPARLFRGGLAPVAFRRLEAMIESAIDEGRPLTLDDMARAIDLSVTHFVRSFRRHTGHTPHRYVVRRRIDRAVSLLRLGRISVADAADEVGFATPAHFVASFRTAIGVTPGAMRKALAS